jgi:hypothetical protein
MPIDNQYSFTLISCIDKSNITDCPTSWFIGLNTSTKNGTMSVENKKFEKSVLPQFNEGLLKSAQQQPKETDVWGVSYFNSIKANKECSTGA